MKMSEQVKPISYLKTHAAEIVRNLVRERGPLFITQNGEAKVVIQDISSYEQTQQTMAMLKILALGNSQIEDGNIFSLADVTQKIRDQHTIRTQDPEKT